MISDRWIEIAVDGENRAVLLHAPVGVELGEVLPLVLVFHGRGIDAEAMVRLCGLTELADRERFMVAYLEGRPDPSGGRYWSIEYTPDAVVTGSSELAFVERTLEALLAEGTVDPSRIYAAGFSNGGILCHVLARWMTDRFAAIASVAGIAMLARFTLNEPIALIHFHGTRDRFIPYDGGKTARKDLPIVFPPVVDMLQPWLEATGCLSLNASRKWQDPNDPSLDIRVEEYGPGWGGSEVTVVTIEGGGHTWPGRAPLVSYLGKWTTAISSSAMIWEFFERHRR